MESVDLHDVAAQGRYVRDFGRARRWRIRYLPDTGERFIRCYGRTFGEWTVEGRDGALRWTYYRDHGKPVTRLLQRVRGIVPGVVDLSSGTELYFVVPTAADAEKLWKSGVRWLMPRVRRELTPEARALAVESLARRRASGA